MLSQTRIFIPDDLIQIFTRLDNNDSLVTKISTEYMKLAQNVFGHQTVINHDSYLNNFYLSKSSKVFLPIYGISSKQLIHIFMKLHTQKTSATHGDIYNKTGFMSNRMYTNPEYLIHLLFIMYVVYKYKKLDFDNQDKLTQSTKVAIALIYALLYNGRIAKYYPRYKDPDVARYLQRLDLPRDFLLRKYTTPSELIFSHYLPSAFKYINEKDLNEHPEQIIYVFSQFWNKLNALFVRITSKYMEAYREGKKLSSTEALNMKKNDEGRDLALTERYTSLRSDIVARVDELSMIITMLPENKVPNGLIQKFIVTPYLFKPDELTKIYLGIIDVNRVEQSEEIYKLILTYYVEQFKVTKLDTICDKLLQIEQAVEKFVKSKRNEQAKELKHKIDFLLSDILGFEMSKHKNRMRVSYYRRVYLFLMMLFVTSSCNRQIKYIDI